jgi:hypothetical protein
MLATLAAPEAARTVRCVCDEELLGMIALLNFLARIGGMPACEFVYSTRQ